MLNVPRLLLAWRICKSLELAFDFLFFLLKRLVSLALSGKTRNRTVLMSNKRSSAFPNWKDVEDTHTHANTRHFSFYSRKSHVFYKSRKNGGTVSRQKCSGPLRERQTGRLINDWQSLLPLERLDRQLLKLENQQKRVGGFFFFFFFFISLFSPWQRLSLPSGWYTLCSVGLEELNALVTWRNKAETRDPSVQ